MVAHEVACRAGRFDPDALAAINSSPLAYLASCAVAHGAGFSRSILRAEAILDRHGASRRIDADEAFELCSAMRTWATGRRDQDIA